jgi:hypothetical protein
MNNNLPKEPLMLVPLTEQMRSEIKRELDKELSGFQGKQIVFTHKWQDMRYMEPNDDNE